MPEINVAIGIPINGINDKISVTANKYIIETNHAAKNSPENAIFIIELNSNAEPKFSLIAYLINAHKEIIDIIAETITNTIRLNPAVDNIVIKLFVKFNAVNENIDVPINTSANSNTGIA